MHRKDKIKNATDLIASLFLNFSQPKPTPPIVKPINIKEIAHKKYITPNGKEHLGKMYKSITLSALPPIIQLNKPKEKATTDVINEHFTLTNLISWLMPSNKELSFFMSFKKITSQQYMR